MTLRALALALALTSGAAAPAAAESLTLHDALALAARNNPELRLVGLQTESAGVETFASWGGVLPRLDVSASFGRNYFGAQKRVITAPELTFDPGTGEPNLEFQQQIVDVPGQGFANYSLGLQLTQPLFDGFRNWNTIRRAKLGEEAAAKQVDEASLAIAFDVTRRFYDLVRAARNAAVLEETVRRSEEFVKRADALFEAGRAPKSEAVAARVNLGNDRINLETQRARVEQARAELAAVLGLEAGQPLEAIAPAEVDAPLAGVAEPPPLGELVTRAKERRPALARYRTLQEVAALDKRIASSDRWPAVAASLGYDRSGPKLAGSDGVWGDPTRQFVASAQLGVQWNLFNGRQTSANEQRAAIGERRVRVEGEQALQQIAADVARAHASLVAIGHSLAIAEDNLRNAEEGVRLARERFQAGATSQLEVRDANLKLTQAQLTVVSARIDYFVARADLNRAVGGAL